MLAADFNLVDPFKKDGKFSPREPKCTLKRCAVEKVCASLHEFHVYFGQKSLDFGLR